MTPAGRPRGPRSAACILAPETACEEQGSQFYHGCCAWCWERIPEDVQERIRWATEEGNAIDQRAAWDAARSTLT